LSRNQRLALVGLAAVVLVVAFVVARSGSEDDDGGDRAAQTQTQPAQTETEADTTETEAETTTTEEQEPARPRTPTINVRDGKPVGGVRKIEASKGDDVAFNVRSDTPQEVHLHGYDISRDAGPGQTARFRFEAKFEGRFEAELEGPHVQVVEVEVSP
jgi:hypothetical protein